MRLIVAVAMSGLGVAWLGCATSNGDPVPGDEPVPVGAPTPDAAARPAFEAGFSDVSTIAPPTPDGAVDTTCNDTNDPGASEVTAKVLPATSDAQNSPITVSGIMAGPVDVDFYKLAVADTSFHLVQPDIKTPTAGIELCTFARCPTGATNVTCKAGTPTKSSLGTDGCCGAGPAAATPTWNCPGLNDSVNLFFRIQNKGSACLPYTFSYAF